MALKVTPEQKKQLDELAAKSTLRQGHARRVRVVLLAADGVSGVEIAKLVGMSHFQVSRIRKRFEEGGVEGLADQPKRGRGNNVPRPVVEKIVAAAMSPPPKGYSRNVRKLDRVVFTQDSMTEAQESARGVPTGDRPASYDSGREPPLWRSAASGGTGPLWSRMRAALDPESQDSQEPAPR
ncbi:MAG TPA: helix-turn-helix domain-containing protein [Haliangium sp.]|nr:helix-turn-helix domain-containing protein [Haliangium sp.]